jgi:hypothetical protein
MENLVVFLVGIGIVYHFDMALLLPNELGELSCIGSLLNLY